MSVRFGVLDVFCNDITRFLGMDWYYQNCMYQRVSERLAHLNSLDFRLGV